MKYKVTLNNRVYEVEVEEGEAMLVDEYEMKAPAAPVPAAAPVAAAAPAASAAPAAPAAPAGGALAAGEVAQVVVAKGAVVETGSALVVIA